MRNVGPEAEEVESAVGADEPAPEIRFLVEVRGGVAWVGLTMACLLLACSCALFNRLRY